MAQCNTIFHQMLKLIPRHNFDKLEAEHGTGRKARSFTRWSQLVHLLSMQLAARASLRDGIASLNARLKSLYHLGVKPVARSTFADANNKRPASFFAELFASMYRRCQPVAPKHKFKFKNKLYSLDATTVSLCNLSVSLQNFMRVLQLNLFRTCSLQELFEPPGPLPDNMNVNNQLNIAWG
jgi:hypothetical protein